MKKRSAKYKREQIHELLASRGRFNMDYGASFGSWSMPGKDYRYRPNAFHRFLAVILRSLVCVFGTLLVKIGYGAKVYGKENLKAIGKDGAISICNHFHILDTLFLRQAVGHFRSYTTVSPINNKRGVFGSILRHGGILPLSADRTAMKNLNDEMKRLLAAGKIINFYPEQALWSHYTKPRPMKRGTFYYAAKFNVPVLPIFCTFTESKKGRIRKLKIHILPPVYPSPELSQRANEEKMQQTAANEWDECYNASVQKN